MPAQQMLPGSKLSGSFLFLVGRDRLAKLARLGSSNRALFARCHSARQFKEEGGARNAPFFNSGLVASVVNP